MTFGIKPLLAGRALARLRVEPLAEIEREPRPRDRHGRGDGGDYRRSRQAHTVRHIHKRRNAPGARDAAAAVELQPLRN